MGCRQNIYFMLISYFENSVLVDQHEFSCLGLCLYNYRATEKMKAFSLEPFCWNDDGNDHTMMIIKKSSGIN